MIECRTMPTRTFAVLAAFRNLISLKVPANPGSVRGSSQHAGAGRRRGVAGKLRGAAWALCGLLLAAAMAHATNYTVNVFTDTTANGLAGGGAGSGSGSTGDLRYAISQANKAGGTNSIVFSCSSASCTITLGGPLPPIESNLTIDGGTFGKIIVDGASSYRVFFVDTGTVTLANLQIQNALAQGGAGGAGGPGGGGGLGAGACLFVNQSGAKVTVQNSYFRNCAASGGAGGGYRAPCDLFAGGGGGGGGMAFNGGDGYNDSTHCNGTGGGGGGGGMLSVGTAGTSSNGGNGGNGGGGGGVQPTVAQPTVARVAPATARTLAGRRQQTNTAIAAGAASAPAPAARAAPVTAGTKPVLAVAGAGAARKAARAATAALAAAAAWVQITAAAVHLPHPAASPWAAAMAAMAMSRGPAVGAVRRWGRPSSSIWAY